MSRSAADALSGCFNEPIDLVVARETDKGRDREGETMTEAERERCKLDVPLLCL